MYLSKSESPKINQPSADLSSGVDAIKLPAVPAIQMVEEEEPVQAKTDPIQKASPEEEEPLQGKFETIQKASPEEDKLLQGKFETIQQASPEEEKPLQGKFETIQKISPEEEKPLQGKFSDVAPVQLVANKTGMPDNLKSGIENLSGLGMDDVKVHYNSPQPAQLNALAYAQGTDIHIAPGQEKHLPHEAWHVAQQKQGRVQPTMQMKEGVDVNDDPGLEHEADVMGARALQKVNDAVHTDTVNDAGTTTQYVIQKFDAGIGAGWHIHFADHIKYAANNATRVNIIGRSRRDIGFAWEQVIQNNGLAGTKNTADFIDCKTWIRRNKA